MCSQITPFPSAQPRFHVKVEDFEPQGFTYLRTLARANVVASTTSGVVAGAAAKVATTIAATKEVRGAMVEAALSQPVLLTVPATDGAAATLVQVLTIDFSVTVCACIYCLFHVLNKIAGASSPCHATGAVHGRCSGCGHPSPTVHTRPCRGAMEH